MLSLKQWRVLRGKTIEEMAKACNVHRNTYSTWEKNPAMIPVGSAMKIAELLETTIDGINFFE